MDRKQIELRFGVLNPKINAQLKKQGFEIKDEYRGAIEKAREAINLLYFMAIISYEMKEKLYSKLFTFIKKRIRVIKSKK